MIAIFCEETILRGEYFAMPIFSDAPISDAVASQRGLGADATIFQMPQCLPYFDPN
jgi:hypothetical protein